MKFLRALSLLDRESRLSLTSLALVVGLLGNVVAISIGNDRQVVAAGLLFVAVLCAAAHRRAVSDRADARQQATLDERLATVNASLEALAKGLVAVKKTADEASGQLAGISLGTLGQQPFVRRAS